MATTDNGRRAIAESNNYNISALTRAINGGQNGIEDRIRRTNDLLNSNISTKLVSRITPSIDNEVLCDIYYSANPAADANLDYAANGWMKEPADISEMKSFLILSEILIFSAISLLFY